MKKDVESNQAGANNGPDLQALRNFAKRIDSDPRIKNALLNAMKKHKSSERTSAETSQYKVDGRVSIGPIDDADIEIFGDIRSIHFKDGSAIEITESGIRLVEERASYSVHKTADVLPEIPEFSESPPSVLASRSYESLYLGILLIYVPAFLYFLDFVAGRDQHDIRYLLGSLLIGAVSVVLIYVFSRLRELGRALDNSERKCLEAETRATWFQEQSQTAISFLEAERRKNTGSDMTQPSGHSKTESQSSAEFWRKRREAGLTQEQLDTIRRELPKIVPSPDSQA